MRTLVAGATGYVGTRLVPALLDAGHEVVAASSRKPRPDRYGWGDGVESLRMDATDAAQVREAVRDVDAVVYLVHSLAGPDFRDRDRLAAESVRDAVDDEGVGRVVYLSGLVPDVPAGALSPHIASRLEVEDILAASTASTLSLRAGVVIGAGSTSFEIVRQLSSVLLVQPVPPWLHSSVQPVAVADVVRALVVAVEVEREGVVDIGGPEVLPYPDLLRAYCEVAGLHRLQLPVIGPSVAVTALTAGLVTAAPYWTVAALVRSLRHDMVCHEVLDPDTAMPVRQAIAAALAEDGIAGPERSDPAWVRPSWPLRAVAAVGLPGSTVLSSALHVAEHRTRRFLGLG
jgi:uncharacterized protein YbjT (DUF2867 family)